MGQEILVREQTVGGRKVIDGLIARGVPVTAAFWMKRDDAPRWYLYIVTSLVETDGPFEAYRAVREVIGECQWGNPSEFVSPSDIKLLEPTHTLATWAVGVPGKYNGTVDAWVHGDWVRDGAVTGTYVYALTPRPAPQPAGS